MGRLYGHFQEHDTEVLVIGGGTPKDAGRIRNMYKLPFPVLADEDRSVYLSYGLDKAMWIVQRSASMLVDKEGIVRYTQQATRPAESLDDTELLATLRAITT